MNTYITTFQLYLGMVLAGIFTGLGSALGNYLANRHIVTNISKLNKLMTKKNGNS